MGDTRAFGEARRAGIINGNLGDDHVSTPMARQQNLRAVCIYFNFTADVANVVTHQRSIPNIAGVAPNIHEQVTGGQPCVGLAAHKRQQIKFNPRQFNRAAIDIDQELGADQVKLGDVAFFANLNAAQLGAHIIKVKPPTAHIEQDAARKVYQAQGIPVATMAERSKHVLDSSFGGKRIVIFSGGEAKSTADLLEEVKGLAQGGAFGSIMGRNAFQRPKAEAIELLHQVQNIFAGRSL